MTGSLLAAVRRMLAAGLTEKDCAEILARTGPGREDEYAVIREVLDRDLARAALGVEGEQE